MKHIVQLLFANTPSNLFDKDDTELSWPYLACQQQQLELLLLSLSSQSIRELWFARVIDANQQALPLPSIKNTSAFKCIDPSIALWQSCKLIEARATMSFDFAARLGYLIGNRGRPSS